MLACACRTEDIFEFYKFKYQKDKSIYNTIARLILLPASPSLSK